MNVFDLFAKLSLDSSEYDKGLDKAKSAGSSLGSGLATAAGIGLKAVTAAASAVGAFGVASVKTGADFDKSMSQVAATMGMTVEQLNATEEQMANMSEAEREAARTAQESFGQLRDFAQEMGRTTAFSASQASDALNYMALAGYDVETSMSMLPNVLNLAAAGDMDLARASDMVTDSATAMGMTLEDGSVDIERVTQMVDEMAKAASTGNTNVEQLGDAFLVVGGLAQELNGGLVTLEDGTTATADGVQELEIALTAMANAGIKGSEAGTHMRNMLLKLASPTSEGTLALEEMGVEVFDLEGNMRSLKDIFGDLSTEMDTMTQAGKIETISALFNTRDIASAEALLNAVGQDWDNIGEAILNADGAAEQMAKTQLDNLAGDITLFKSALEGAKIAVSDELTPSLRDFVKFGTDGLSTLTGAFKEGGLTGAMEAFGTILSNGLNMIIKKIPKFMEAGTKLIGALGKGLLDNLPVILDAATQILTQLGEGLIAAAPALLDGAAQIIGALGQYLIENVPSMITAIGQIMLQIVTMLTENIDQIIPGIIAFLTGFGQAMIENIAVLLPAVIQLLMAISLALVDNLPLLIQSVIDMITMLVQVIIENAPLFLDAVVQILAAIVMMIIDYGAQALTAMGEWLSNMVTSVGEWFSNMLTTVVTWLSQLPTQMAYWAGFAIGEMIKFFMELPGKVATFLSNTISKVQDFGSRLKTKAKEMAQAFFNNLVDKISQLPSKLVELGQNMVSAITDLPDKFLEIGKNIVEGIWNGISAGWDWLITSVKELAESLLQGAKDALGIASPSKKFKWVGEMVDEGFALGITSNIDEVRDAMNSLMAATEIPTNDISVASAFDGTSGVYGGFNQYLTINSPRELNPSEIARQTRNANREMVLRLRTT